MREIKPNLYAARFKHIKVYKSSPDMVVQACDLSTVEAQAGGGWHVPGQSGSHSKALSKRKTRKKKNT